LFAGDGDKFLIGKKIEIAKRTITKHIDFLRCPLCGEAFGIDNYSLRCRNNHTYDISRKGYVNLFSGYTKITKTYDRKLFEARKIISDAGLYGKLCESLAPLVERATSCGTTGGILDAGCGCGNLTVDIFKILQTPGGNADAAPFQNQKGAVKVFAVDLSKDGIDFAAGNFCGEDLLWIVGNLNNLPVADNKIGVILNIMSPANYIEFDRTLESGGVLIKVLPDADYLKELRQFIYKENDKTEYSNKDVLTNLEENMSISDITDVRYTREIAAEHIPALFDMTPLTLNISERDKIREQLINEINKNNKNNFEVTLAFKIAVCRKGLKGLKGQREQKGQV
jgi:23S rRNA (guanine745-N1)-methyltransferase